MDVSATTLRSDLKAFLARAARGETIVVTDRGRPVARIVGIDDAAKIEQLMSDGIIGRPAAARRPSAHEHRRVNAAGPVAELVGDQRR